MKNGARILIVDDEPNIRLMLRTALASEGYELGEAVDGHDALDAIGRQVPELVILDLSMPRLDGMGVLSELRTLPADRRPRVIVLTAYGSIPAAVKATRLGAMDFLEKPVVPDEVREAVEAVLKEPLPDTADLATTVEASPGYAGVLDQVRRALRLAHYTDAETLLMKAADLGLNDAAYFNLLGVLYEARHEWRVARRFYGKAMKSDRRYEPAQRNMRRIYELHTFGKAREPVAVGEEALELWTEPY